MKPRKNYRTRPKKTGAKKNYRIKTQKKRLAAAGVEPEKLKHITVVEIRELLKKTAMKKRGSATAAAAQKKTVKKTKSAPRAKKA